MGLWSQYPKEDTSWRFVPIWEQDYGGRIAQKLEGFHADNTKFCWGFFPDSAEGGRADRIRKAGHI